MKTACDACINKPGLCEKCSRNPKYNDLADYFKAYNPLCPRGYRDCVCDPAYIKYAHPDRYESLYGDKPPYEAAEDCREKMRKDPTDMLCCYENEDK